MKIKVSEGQTSIISLYEEIARKLGWNPDDVGSYDCKKIEVARNIQDAIFEDMRTKGYPDYEVGMIWVCYGPKVNEELSNNECIVEDGFLSE